MRMFTVAMLSVLVLAPVAAGARHPDPLTWKLFSAPFPSSKLPPGYSLGNLQIDNVDPRAKKNGLDGVVWMSLKSDDWIAFVVWKSPARAASALTRGGWWPADANMKPLGRVPGFAGKQSRLDGGVIVEKTIAEGNAKRAISVAAVRRGRVNVEALTVETSDGTSGDPGSTIRLLRAALAHYDTATS